MSDHQAPADDARDPLREEDLRLQRRLEMAEATLRRTSGGRPLGVGAAGLVAWNLDLGTDAAYHSPHLDLFFGHDAPLPAWSYDVFLEHVVEEDRPLVDAAFRGAQRQDAHRDVECQIRRADGSVGLVEIAVLSIGSGTVAAILRDIRDHRAPRTRPLLCERALAAIAEGVVVAEAEADHPIVYVNAGFEDLTGYPAGECLGRNCRFLQGPASDPQAVGALRAAIRAHEPVRQILRNYRRDGSPFWNEVAVGPVKDADGRTTHYIGVQQDVTDAVYERTSADVVRVLSVSEPPRVHEALAQLGSALSASRGYVYRLRPDAPDLALLDAWSGGGAARGTRPFVPIADLPWLLKRLDMNEAIRVSDFAHDAEYASELRAVVSDDARTLVAVPVWAEEAGLLGLIGFEDDTAARAWTDGDVRLLRTAGHVLASALARRDASQRLAEREALHRSLLEALPDALFRLSADGVVQEAQLPPDAPVHLQPEAIEGQALADLLPSDLAHRARARLHRALQTGAVVQWETDVEWEGRPLALDVRFAPLSEGALAIIRDVSTERQLEVQLLDAVALTQRRIGRDLHDGLGQELTGLAYMVRALRLQLAGAASDNAVGGILDRLTAGIEAAIGHTHAHAHGLNPIELDRAGLGPALASLCERTAEVHGLRCDLTSTVSDELDEEVAYHLFRVAQEAITNAVKHADADAISVSLLRDQGHVVLEVHDSGRGFDVEADHTGMGLASIEYRARSIGATWQVESAPLSGTRVRIRVPD